MIPINSTRVVDAIGVPCDVVVREGVPYRMYVSAHNFEPVACTNLARRKQMAAELLARIQRL